MIFENVLWFESGAGSDVLEQSEETKLQCVVRTSPDLSNGVRVDFVSSITTHPSFTLDRYS